MERGRGDGEERGRVYLEDRSEQHLWRVPDINSEDFIQLVSIG